MPLADQRNHEISVVEVGGTHKSADLLRDNSKIIYWNVTDVLADQGSQHGYYKRRPR